MSITDNDDSNKGLPKINKKNCGRILESDNESNTTFNSKFKKSKGGLNTSIEINLPDAVGRTTKGQQKLNHKFKGIKTKGGALTQSKVSSYMNDACNIYKNSIKPKTGETNLSLDTAAILRHLEESKNNKNDVINKPRSKLTKSQNQTVYAYNDVNLKLQESVLKRGNGGRDDEPDPTVLASSMPVVDSQ